MVAIQVSTGVNQYGGVLLEKKTKNSHGNWKNSIEVSPASYKYNERAQAQGMSVVLVQEGREGGGCREGPAASCWETCALALPTLPCLSLRALPSSSWVSMLVFGQETWDANKLFNCLFTLFTKKAKL